MNSIKLLIVCMLTVFSANASAYGSSSSNKQACKKPKMSQFTPAKLTVVAPQSAFSFQTSALTNPESIKVNVKDLPVEVDIKAENNGYLVTGNLPAALQDTYARINISATGTNQCKGSDGWLLKIENTQP
ncbi:MAG: hypothetical protein K9L22_09855 [Methylococcaceae bacterium]|nr:hypothetical protein [Methylococcaceae bacterium]